MSKYQNSKIYKLVSPHTDEIYIGSTVQRLCHRLSGHKRDCREGKICTNKKLFELGGVKIILIEEFPCDNKEQLLKRERHHIENNECLNIQIPGRTRKEYYQEHKEHLSKKSKIRYENNKEEIAEKGKEYREKNQEEIKQKKKEYREKNKDKIKKRKLEKKICECGSTYSHCQFARHKKSIKHQSYLSNKSI